MIVGSGTHDLLTRGCDIRFHRADRVGPLLENVETAPGGAEEAGRVTKEPTAMHLSSVAGIPTVWVGSGVSMIWAGIVGSLMLAQA